MSMALKYADNIQKTFAVGISIVLNCAVSTLFLGVTLHWRAAVGVAMVVGSTIWFNRAADGSAFDAEVALEDGTSRKGTYLSVAGDEPLRETSSGEEDDVSGGGSPGKDQPAGERQVSPCTSRTHGHAVSQ